MPFGNLTANAVIFEPRKPGVYQATTVTLGSPANEFRFTGASKSKTSKLLSMSVTRIKQKDVIPAGGTVPIRKPSICTVNFQIPDDGSFTQTEADSLLSDINEVVTASILLRLANNEI